jgi:hypothetical protein
MGKRKLNVRVKGRIPYGDEWQEVVRFKHGRKYWALHERRNPVPRLDERGLGPGPDLDPGSQLHLRVCGRDYGANFKLEWRPAHLRLNRCRHAGELIGLYPALYCQMLEWLYRRDAGEAFDLLWPPVDLPAIPDAPIEPPSRVQRPPAKPRRVASRDTIGAEPDGPGWWIGARFKQGAVTWSLYVRERQPDDRRCIKLAATDQRLHCANYWLFWSRQRADFTYGGYADRLGQSRPALHAAVKRWLQSYYDNDASDLL